MSFVSKCQTISNQHEIDSIINVRRNEKDKLKESGTLVGQLKVYRKILGIKIRKKKGEGYHEFLFYNNKLLLHREVSIWQKHYGDNFESEEYYYIDNKLVKYHRTIDKRTKKREFPKNKATLYLKDGKIISAESKDAVKPWTLNYLTRQKNKDIEMKWD